MLARIEDWTALKGKYVEVRIGDRTLCAGVVGAVSEDGSTLWMQPYCGPRLVFSKNDPCEIWASQSPR